MSIRYEIKKSDDVELSDDGREIEVLFDIDSGGNYYVDIPVNMVKKLFVCGWTHAGSDEGRNFFNTECGQGSVVETGGDFCNYCGGKIQIT